MTDVKIAEVTTIQSMPDTDLKQFVIDFADQKIFSSAHLHREGQDSLLKSVFMPLMGVVFSKEAIDEMGIIYEYLGQQGPVSINGYPMFISMRLMNKIDWARAAVAINKLTATRAEANNKVEL